ncbi:unnamed protein product [Mytilus edulis]|uniref:Uncharacterized protein n=1 Tax=Mytilus edulis TaxID=6550 RepID=A0A8S3S2F8_MYTED|nr:unnamed protein product [Mytilus edulis]
MLKSSQKDEIESCLNNATLSIKTNSNATDRDNFSTTIFEVFPGLERDLLSAENIQVTEYIAINQTPHTSTPKECIAETNSEIFCDYSEETEVCFAIQPIAHVSPSDAIPSCSGVKRKEKTVKKRRSNGNRMLRETNSFRICVKKTRKRSCSPPMSTRNVVLEPHKQVFVSYSRDVSDNTTNYTVSCVEEESDEEHYVPRNVSSETDFKVDGKEADVLSCPSSYETLSTRKNQ